MRHSSLIVLIGIVVLAVFVVWKVDDLPLPIGITHTVHLLSPPKDFYHPIVEEEFNFHERNFTGRYQFAPRYRDIYEVGISFGEFALPSTFQFKGALQISVYQRGELLQQKRLSGELTKYYRGTDTSKLERIGLGTFTLDDVARDATRQVVVTVLEPDQGLLPTEYPYKLYIRVSGSP